MREFILCSCSHSDHLIILNLDDNKEYCSMEVHLSPLPFFKRLINGIKYIFGFRSRYGDFDEIMINREKAEGIKQFMDKVLENEKFF